MPLEAELQRSDTRACGFGQLRKVERLVRVRMEKFARPPERLRQRFGPAAKPVDRIAGAVALAVEQTSKQGLTHVGRCDRRKRPLRAEAFGEIDELQNLRCDGQGLCHDRKSDDYLSAQPGHRDLQQ